MASDIQPVEVDITVRQEGGKQDDATNPQAMTLYNQQRIIQEIIEQPSFRAEMDKCADYYDGNQLDQETLDALNQKGMGPLVANLIRPTVDVVLGMEAKTRTEWRINADTDDAEDVAQALTIKLREGSRETRAGRARGDAYAGQIKVGVGWVEVGRNADPFKYPYRVQPNHRREHFWDWIEPPGIGEPRYHLRRRWFDVEQLKTFFPDWAQMLDGISAGYNLPDDLTRAQAAITYGQSLDIERGWTFEDYQWRDVARKRLCLYELWYRVYVRGYVLRLPSGKVVEFKTKDPAHREAVSRGLVKPEPAVYSKLRMSIWVGPYKLRDMDGPSRELPYVPFWGYREDLTGIPYGLIRGMMSPQDEINARRRKLMWLLSAKRLKIDSDALDHKFNSIQDVLDSLATPEGVIVMNPARRNVNGVEVDDNAQLSNQQFEVLQDAMQSIPHVSGVYQAMLGEAKSGQSGRAVNSLIEQGVTTLAEINDNYSHSSTQVGELLLDLIKDDLMGQEVQVIAGERGRRRTIVLNQRQQDPQTGEVQFINDIARSKTKLALEDVPNTPAYRAEVQAMLAETMQALPPQLQAIIAPFWMEASELPKRREIAELMRKTLNIPDLENPNAEDPRITQLTQMVQQLQEALQGPDSKLKLAQAAAAAAAAELSHAKAEQIDVQNHLDLSAPPPPAAAAAAPQGVPAPNPQGETA